MRKKFKSLGRFLVRCLIATAVILVLIFIRLAYSPTPVDFLGETITEPFDAAFPNQDLTYRGVFLEWNWDHAAFEFSLSDAAVRNDDGTTLAAFPRLAIDFDALNLFAGNFIPERVDIYGAEINMDWGAKGFQEKVENALFNPDEELPTPEELERPPVIRFMETLLKGEGEDSPLKDLKEVSVTNSTITLLERDSGVVWTMPGSDVVISRSGVGLALDADLTLVSEGEEVEIAVRSEKTGDGLNLTRVEMQGLNPTRLAREVGLTGIFETANMPLYGSVSLFQNEKGGINHLGFDLGGGPGTIFYAPFQNAPAAFEDMVFKGTLSPAEKVISVELLRLSVDEAVIEGDGFVEFEEGEGSPGVRMVFTGSDLSIKTLLKLWPPVPRSGGREWIEENITSGKLTGIQAEMAFTPETWGQKPLPNDAFHIAMEFEGGDIHFLRPMPPMTSARGVLTIEGNELHALVESGIVDGLEVNDLRFDIADLTLSKHQMGHASFALKGDMQRFMRFVDQEPLNVFSKNNIDPGDYFGAADLVARLEVPLYQDAPPEATTYTIEGTITDARAPKLMADGGLTEGVLQMTITPAGLVANGTGKLKEVPFDFYWTQDFSVAPANPFTTRVELVGDLSDDDLHIFGLPDDLTMEGTARVYMSLKGKDGDLKEGTGTGDFFKAKVEAPKMDWHKAANRRADASFDLEWTETELLVRNAVIKSPELTFQGGFIFDRQTGLMIRADVPVYVAGRHDLNATARQLDNGVLDVTINARTLNAIPFLETMFEDTGESFAPNMQMRLMAAEVYGLNAVQFSNFSSDALKLNEYWVEANVLGAIDDGGVFQLALTHDDQGRHLQLESDNAGRLALGADVFRNATGGRLVLSADMNVFEDPLFAEGTMSATDFRMVKSSVLIAKLAEDERSGLDEMIREGGVTFAQLEIPFVLSDGIFDISDAKITGPSLGFTMEGEIDQEFNRLNINGTIVPAYSLNTFISRIPIIGTIIAGGSGEGLFGLNYRITGTRENPNVDFKPLSAVAPGILRKLLGSQKKGKLEPEPSLRDQVEEEQGAEGEGEGAAEPVEQPADEAAEPASPEEKTGDDDDDDDGSG